MTKFWAHSTAFIDDKAKIGDDTKIWQFCNIMHDAVIGNKCNIGQNVFIENGVILGDDVKVKNNISIYTGVVCEDKVFLGPSCVFTNVINPRSFINRKSEFKQTLICEGASIGANSTIICGNKIGRYAMIGAGSVVTKPIRDYTMAKGNPARFAGYVCKCGEKLEHVDNLYICSKCGLEYTMQDGVIKPLEEII